MIRGRFDSILNFSIGENGNSNMALPVGNNFALRFHTIERAYEQTGQRVRSDR